MLNIRYDPKRPELAVIEEAAAKTFMTFMMPMHAASDIRGLEYLFKAMECGADPIMCEPGRWTL